MQHHTQRNPQILSPGDLRRPVSETSRSLLSRKKGFQTYRQTLFPVLQHDKRTFSAALQHLTFTFAESLKLLYSHICTLLSHESQIFVYRKSISSGRTKFFSERPGKLRMIWKTGGISAAGKSGSFSHTTHPEQFLPGLSLKPLSFIRSVHSLHRSCERFP